jgi:hypothetical protein
VVNAGIPSPDTAGAGEWSLDSQSSTGIAQQVSHLYFYVATSLQDSDIALAISRAVEDNRVKAFNMSFGECEFSAYLNGAMLVDDEMFAEAALQGMTPFASTGDQGSACPVLPTNGVPLSGPPAAAYPAASPYVIAVGGTNLFTKTDYTFDFEVGWESGGGGPSYLENPPFWQAYTGKGTLPIVPSSGGSAVGAGRGLPDISMCGGGTVLGGSCNEGFGVGRLGCRSPRGFGMGQVEIRLGLDGSGEGVSAIDRAKSQLCDRSWDVRGLPGFNVARK